MRKNTLGKKLLSLALAVTVVGSGFAFYGAKDSEDAYAVSGKPSIEKTDYDGKGKVEVEFYGDVKYYNTKVTVTKLSTGQTYNAEIIKKDSDDIEFISPSYTSGCKYKYTISGVKKYRASSYTSVSGYFTVPKATTIKIEEIEYDAEDRELSVDFKTRVNWKNPTVNVYSTSGTYICSGRILEKDSDGIEVRLSKSLSYGKKYTCKISGVKAKTASEYKTISKKFYAVD